jgi:hypothetical protein
MSPQLRALRSLCLVAVALLLAVGCAKKRSNSPFDPDTGHPEGFFERHQAEFKSASETCLQCHGADMMGGIVQVSCFSLTNNDRSCHPGGPGGGHPAGWSVPGSHGVVAKSGTSASSGLASCKSCHGADFSGGSAVSCYSCHGVNAPHAKAPWRSGPLTHTNTNPDNAPVCSQCHQRNAGTPGCFNNTLCHGEAAGHEVGWAKAGAHGAAAMASTPGLASCQACHGSNYGGGTGPSCFDCHRWKAAHGKPGWDGGGPNHRKTRESNVAVCAQCHRRAQGSPGCFNNTLCHGQAAGHPGGWGAGSEHGAAAKGNPGGASGFGSCQACHGSGFTGGTSAQSCFPCHGWNAPHARKGWIGGGTNHRSTDSGNAGVCAQCHRRTNGTAGCFNNTLCHGAGGTHPENWPTAGQHGPVAKSAPGGTSGFPYCQSCHGGGFAGGTSGRSCFACHGWDAPHGRTGWVGGGTSHRSTNEGNADVCALCHRSAGGTAGCFNSTLCHGAGANHPAGWAASNQHGPAAKGAPGATAGFAYCQDCHGNGFNGGTSGQSCFPCHGWNAPHGQTGWNGGGGSHRSTSSGNADVCAQCHRSQAGTAGCFNSTLCH